MSIPRLRLRTLAGVRGLYPSDKLSCFIPPPGAAISFDTLRSSRRSSLTKMPCCQTNI